MRISPSYGGTDAMGSHSNSNIRAPYVPRSVEACRRPAAPEHNWTRLPVGTRGFGDLVHFANHTPSVFFHSSNGSGSVWSMHTENLAPTGSGCCSSLPRRSRPRLRPCRVPKLSGSSSFPLRLATPVPRHILQIRLCQASYLCTKEKAICAPHHR